MNQSFSSSYAGAADSAAARRTTLDDRVSSCRDDYASLEEAVAVLEQRLGRVCTRPLNHNTPRVEKAAESVPVLVATPNSEVGREVDALGVGMRRLTERMRDLVGALDL